MRHIYSTSALPRQGSSPLAGELLAIYAAIDGEPVLSALARYRWIGLTQSAEQREQEYERGSLAG